MDGSLSSRSSHFEPDPVGPDHAVVLFLCRSGRIQMRSLEMLRGVLTDVVCADPRALGVEADRNQLVRVRDQVLVLFRTNTSWVLADTRRGRIITARNPTGFSAGVDAARAGRDITTCMQYLSAQYTSARRAPAGVALTLGQPHSHTRSLNRDDILRRSLDRMNVAGGRRQPLAQ